MTDLTLQDAQLSPGVDKSKEGQANEMNSIDDDFEDMNANAKGLMHLLNTSSVSCLLKPLYVV